MIKTVLIVDDDTVLRNALAMGLRNDGFNVLTAESADVARDILRRISVNAIVLDRMMTGTDGLTFLRNLRGAGDTTPVLMLTALSGAENAIAGLSSGANDYLAKPFQIRELILRLNNIMPLHSTSDAPMPHGLEFSDNEFFITSPDTTHRQMLSLSGEEKKLLQLLTRPMGNIAPAAPMVAKRLRNKLNLVLSTLDIITVRGRGYKLVDLSTTTNNTPR